MSLLERFQHYAAEFEKTYLDDDWSRLEPFFTEDAVYEVQGLEGLSGKAEGRQAIFDMIRESLDRFDRRLDRRELRTTAPPEVTDDSVTIHWSITYGPAENAFVVQGSEVATYKGERIRRLEDVYSPEMAEAFARWRQTL